MIEEYLYFFRAEALDYLASLYIEMKKLGLDPEERPTYCEGAFLPHYYQS